ncbi:breast cancer anti-estrogen resistance protein 1-like isoform X2 [Myxocyprinus asiaticus]|uniref:breast cancer anti-estrogen resistance protein 1-like isoform X2 n=1 Tax=Myxocyprinus asiaticus TaxID=70543 RepID=UPI002222EB93|nr:breast cancer anti-estrogen resistance protein 1-like isoform X2 [Myxocyprinus asiaticus]
MNYLNVLAKALYDNVAESPDELSFRKGDIMTVLERDTQGLDGWWLCSLHGRQGIVPGNRLKILVGMYDKQQQQQLQQSSPQPSPAQSHLNLPQSAFSKPIPASQYTAMHPAFASSSSANSTNPDSVYMLPPSHGLPASSSLYQVPTGPQPPQPQPKAPAVAQKQSQAQYPPSSQDVYQVPPSINVSGQEIYQVPPTAGGPCPGQDVYQVPPSVNQTQDVYQIPPSIERNWDSPKPIGKVVVPTRVGQVYVYDTGKNEQDEYDVPRHLPPTQDIYDVPPTRTQYNQQVYDTPPMAMKGPPGRDAQEIYDIPPSVDKSQLLYQQTVYDIPPSVSKDVPDGPIREETYDVPPHFAKMKAYENQNQAYLSQIPGGPEPPIPEDVYDVPPPQLIGKRQPEPQEIYDIPASLCKGGPQDQNPTDVYDFPRERPTGEDSGDYVYDVPPQVVRDAAATEELTVSFKRLSASSTGSTRSNLSTSSLDMVPVRESSGSSRLLLLDLDQAMERLSRLQQSVESSVSLLMSFISGNWRSPTQMETNLAAIRQAVERIRVAVRDLLEFARGAVANATQATDRTLQTKLGKQVQKMEEAFQGLVKYSQALDSMGWSPSALMAPPTGTGGDDLDQLVMCARGVPDDTKQLASFLHGNASLLFKRTNKQQQFPLPPVPHTGDMLGQLTNNNNISAYQSGTPERASIQSRPLPSPPKFTAEEEAPDRPYETTEEGWMEDYDYVHLQGKEEFEKNQRQLLEKGSIKHNKTILEQQQLKQFERLEQEVSRPINNDISGWTPPSHYSQTPRSKLCMGDRQLLLFYMEQCEANITTLTNAIDAFYSSINNNQPPKIFVAHSKFVILSAHKLVFIGDTLSRQAKSPEVRARVAQHSNTLCEKLKDIVVSTKTAALQYPSPGAARDMTERVRELAGCTQQFRMALNQLLAM